MSVISTLGGLAGLWIVNQNWFRRQETKYRYQIKRAKLNHKYKTDVNEKPSTLESLGSLAGLAKNLDSDQISGLLDYFTNRDEGETSELAEILPLAQSVLEGINSNKKPPLETEKGNY